MIPDSGEDAGAAPAERLSIRANFAWMFAGNIVYAACQWGILAVMARLGSSELVGRFALGLAISAPVFMFAHLNLRTVQATDTRSEYAFGHYLALRLIAAMAALFGILGFAAVSGYRRETALTVACVALAKTVEAVSDVFYGRLQQRERMDRIALSAMIRGPLSLAAVTVAVWATGSAAWGAAALASAGLTVFVLYDIRVGARAAGAGGGRALAPLFEWRRLGRLFLLALPLALASGAASLYDNIPRYALVHFLGESELGVYAAIAYLFVIVDMFVRTMSTSAMVALAGQFTSDCRKFLHTLLKLVGIAALFSALVPVCAAIAPRALLVHLYGEAFAGATAVFLGLAVAAVPVSLATVLSLAVSAARLFWSQMGIHSASVLVAFAVAWHLGPRMGLMGAVYSVAVGAVAKIAAHVIVLSWHCMEALGLRKGAMQ
jgi:O-antigen/teichoic acid export membrane protein